VSVFFSTGTSVQLYVLVSIHFNQTTAALFPFQTEKAPHAKRGRLVLTIYGKVAPTFYMPHREWVSKEDHGKVAPFIPLSSRYSPLATLAFYLIYGYVNYYLEVLT
jgi:hypothetical protein